MSKAEILCGICGFTTLVEAKMEGKACSLTISSQCESIQRMAIELTAVNPIQEISYHGSTPLTLQMAVKHCRHAACPAPIGIIKAIEVEAGLALPADVMIRLSKSDEGKKRLASDDK